MKKENRIARRTKIHEALILALLIMVLIVIISTII